MQYSSKRYTLILSLSAMILSIPMIQQSFANPVAKGKTLYATCTACHGPNGLGNKALNSPAIATQEAWYLKRQLKNFKAGIRGTHPKDVYGAQMRPMSMTLANDEAIDQVIAYISTFKAPPKEDLKSIKGDPVKGKSLYATCTACHGANAKGNQALNAPKILTLPSWYMLTQLKNFKAGIRGTHPKDTYGAQMRPMSMTLANEQAMLDVIAYIKSLQ